MDNKGWGDEVARRKADGNLSYYKLIYYLLFPIKPVKVDSSSVEILEKDIPSEISLSESKQIVVVNNRPNSVRGVDVRVKAESDGLEFTPERIFIGDLRAHVCQ